MTDIETPSKLIDLTYKDHVVGGLKSVMGLTYEVWLNETSEGYELFRHKALTTFSVPNLPAYIRKSVLRGDNPIVLDGIFDTEEGVTSD